MAEQRRRVAVITGGSSGLGLAMARRLGREGYALALLARRPGPLDEAATEIRTAGSETVGLPCDVTRHDQLLEASQEIRARFGAVDFLILNAGVVHTGRVEDFDRMEDLKADIDVNLWGAVLSARVFLPLMAPGGRILFVSSGFGLMGAAGYAAYCAAKAGMINFAAALRRELSGRGIAVYVACPADIDTPGYRTELAGMPGWMQGAKARGRAMSSDVAAERILRRCAGGRFLIIINKDVRLLTLTIRLLPMRWVNAILDRLFPRPDTPRT